MTNTMLSIFNDAFIESVHVYICIHVVVVPDQLTCRRCTEFNYVSAAPDYMVRKKIRQKSASINYFHCYAVDKFAAFAIICC